MITNQLKREQTRREINYQVHLGKKCPKGSMITCLPWEIQIFPQLILVTACCMYNRPPSLSSKIIFEVSSYSSGQIGLAQKQRTLQGKESHILAQSSAPIFEGKKETDFLYLVLLLKLYTMLHLIVLCACVNDQLAINFGGSSVFIQRTWKCSEVYPGQA